MAECKYVSRRGDRQLLGSPGPTGLLSVLCEGQSLIHTVAFSRLGSLLCGASPRPMPKPVVANGMLKDGPLCV